MVCGAVATCSSNHLVSEANSNTQLSGVDLAAILGRWLLGGLFVYMGAAKALEPVDFLKLVHEYHLVNTPLLLNSIAAALPWFEIFCGFLLLMGIAVRGSALLLICMLVPFTVLVFRRALDVAGTEGLSFWRVKFDCGCGNGEVLIWRKLIENCLLILIAAGLLTGHGARFCARFQLLGRSPRPA